MHRFGRNISEIRVGIKKGLFGKEDVLQASKVVTEKISSLNAFVHICDPPSENVQSQGDDKMLSAMPVAIKDNFCVSGTPTTCGSEMLRNFVPSYDATVVSRIKNQGGVIVGKTNTDEFGMGSGCIDSIFGPTRSVWRSGVKYALVNQNGEELEGVETGPMSDGDWIISGGSSGGSAVAVASGACVAAIGSDTGGSVRVPGAWNGVPTFKPTYGSVSRHGLIPLVNSLDVPGIMARCVRDVRTVFECIKGRDELDSTTVDLSTYPEVSEQDLDGITVGIPKEYYCEDMSDETLEAWSEAANIIESNGIKVVPVSLPHTKYSITCYSVLNPCEVASNMARYDGLEFGLRSSEDEKSTDSMFASTRKRGFNYVVRGRVLAGNYFLLKENYEDYFVRAMKVRRLVCQDFDNVWDSGVDVLLTPVTLETAPRFSSFNKLDNRTQTTKQDYCTQPANLAGIPAATLPCKISAVSHLPISLQILGQNFQDDLVLRFSQWLEDELRFPQLVLK